MLDQTSSPDRPTNPGDEDEDDRPSDVGREAVLLKTGALQDAIFNSANFSSIATDEKGVIQIFNVGAERMLGYRATEVVNRITPADISDPLEVIARAKALSIELGTIISPGFEALVFKARRGIEDIYELTYIRKDSTRFPAIVSVTALRDQRNCVIGYLLIGTDNSARKQVEDQLRSTEETFRLMVESVSDYAIVMLDPTGHVVSWNSGAQRIMGYSADLIIGQHFSRFYTSEHTAQGSPQRDLDAVAANGRFEDETWRVRKDGSHFWANVAITAIRDHRGSLRGFAQLTRDLTQRNLVEKELTDAKLIAEEANQAKSDFLSSMSHELRSPLNAILGFAQLMESDAPPPTPSQTTCISQILTAGWHLLRLIDEILDLAKVESGHMPVSREPVSLTGIIAECQSMIEPLAQPRGIQVTYPELVPTHFVMADQTRLKQVLINLLTNAVKYNLPWGKITVSCTYPSPERTRISVRDTGMGLDHRQLKQLFQPFNRLGQEAGSEEGTGIGLVVAKRLVELMGGSIGAESTVGTGSTFWFELATATAPIDSASAELTRPCDRHDTDRTRQHTLLYVEDNPANLALIQGVLARESGISLLSAVDGMDGIQAARASKPDVILMDINLPGLSGIEVLEVLRRDPETASIPAIAISANAMPRDIERGLKAGFCRYVTKPINVPLFLQTINEVLEFGA